MALGCVFLRLLHAKGSINPISRNIIRGIGSSSFRLDKKQESDGEGKNKELKETGVDTLEKNQVKCEEKPENKVYETESSKEVVFTDDYTSLSYIDPKKLLEEDAADRIARILKYDLERGKEKWMEMLGIDFEVKSKQYLHGPKSADIVIIGGGCIGSSSAYFLQKNFDDACSVLVIERDPTYSTAACSLSVSGIRQQFSLRENIEMALFGAEFMRTMDYQLAVKGLPKPNPCFEPYGHLLLATEEEVETLTENSELQNFMGAKNVLLNSKSLKERFPWLNTDGIALGCLGLRNEGWIDPWVLTLSMKTKAISLGAQFIQGEVVGFKFGHPLTSNSDSWYFKRLSGVIIKHLDGTYNTIDFAHCVIAAGANSGLVGQLAGFGIGDGVFKIPLPIHRKKRQVFSFHCADGPGLDTPFLNDSSGVYFRRDGLCNNYVCGMSSSKDDEPATGNLEVDYDYFNEKIKPLLIKRVPCFENLTVKNGWAGAYELNIMDMNGIIGRHPIFNNIFFACGFNHPVFAPAVGRAVYEQIFFKEYETINLDRLGFKRFMNFDFLVENTLG